RRGQCSAGCFQLMQRWQNSVASSQRRGGARKTSRTSFSIGTATSAQAPWGYLKPLGLALPVVGGVAPEAINRYNVAPRSKVRIAHWDPDGLRWDLVPWGGNRLGQKGNGRLRSISGAKQTPPVITSIQYGKLAAA